MAARAGGQDAGHGDRKAAARRDARRRDGRQALHRSALFRPFPLAFVAQFHLADLAERGALDPALPRRGLLSVFHDVTWKGREGPHWVSWHDRPPGDFDRVAPPEALVGFHDRAGVSHDADGPRWRAWRHRAHSDRLHPFHAVTVPDHGNDVLRSAEVGAEDGEDESGDDGDDGDDDSDERDEDGGDDAEEFGSPARSAA